MVEVAGVGVDVEAGAAVVASSQLDEIKGVLATVVGMIRQVISYVWGYVMTLWKSVMEDPWKMAHLSVTGAILFS